MSGVATIGDAPADTVPPGELGDPTALILHAQPDAPHPAIRPVREDEDADVLRATIEAPLLVIDAADLPDAPVEAWRVDYPAGTVSTVELPAPLPPLKRYQFWAVIELAGLLGAVEAAIAALEDPDDPDADPAAAVVIRARLRHTDLYHRTDPLFDLIGPGAGVTPPQIVAMWAWGAEL